MLEFSHLALHFLCFHMNINLLVHVLRGRAVQFTKSPASMPSKTMPLLFFIMYSALHTQILCFFFSFEGGGMVWDSDAFHYLVYDPLACDSDYEKLAF